MKKQTKRFMTVVAVFCLATGTVFGATVGTKISAQLLEMKIVKDNQQVLQGTKVISYNGSTYVPLRAFGEVTGVAIDYKQGTIYLGNNNTIVENTNSSIISRNPYEDVLPSLNKNVGATKISDSKYYDERYKYIDKAHNLIKGTLKDPMTVVFDYDREGFPEMWVTQDGTLVINVTYKAKNSYGGYGDGVALVSFRNGDINNHTLY